MSVRKVKTSAGETKWEVRLYENGRGSKRTTRRFDRKDDAQAFEVDFKKKMVDRENDPFGGVSLKDRIFREEAEYWLANAKLKFSALHSLASTALLVYQLSLYAENRHHQQHEAEGGHHVQPGEAHDESVPHSHDAPPAHDESAPHSHEPAPAPVEAPAPGHGHDHGPHGHSH